MTSRVLFRRHVLYRCPTTAAKRHFQMLFQKSLGWQSQLSCCIATYTIKIILLQNNFFPVECVQVVMWDKAKSFRRPKHCSSNQSRYFQAKKVANVAEVSPSSLSQALFPWKVFRSKHNNDPTYLVSECSSRQKASCAERNTGTSGKL